MSDSKRASRPASIALVLGLLAILAIPIAVAVAVFRDDVDVLNAVIVGVIAAFVLGLLAVLIVRRARRRVERSVRRTGDGFVRTTRIVAWAGVYAAVTGGLALAFYGVLRASA